MSAQLCKSFRLSSALNITEDQAMDTMKQGIVSILGSDAAAEGPTKATSLRRTLSADMSSEKWRTHYGLSPIKKSASSKEFPVSVSSEEGEETEARGQFDIWTSIQREKNKKELENPGLFDIWSSITSQKAEGESSKSASPPYIHPLVKRSASSLSKKSLEICTESLGSETGSDVFSSYPPSESGDMEEDKQEEDQELQQQKQERVAPPLASFDGEKARVAKYSNDVGKKSPNRSFPPPIPSLSGEDGASSTRFKTYRDNGKLVIEAVSMASQNNFLAQRQDGRLVLTFAITGTPSEAESEINEVMNVEEVMEAEELEEEFEGFGEKEKESEIDIEEGEGEEEEEESENEIEGVLEDRRSEMEQALKLSSGAINVHRLAATMNKPQWLANKNPTWPKNFDEIVKIADETEEKTEPNAPPPLAQSLPPWPRVARVIPSSPPPTAVAAAGAAASFNAYEYYWRRPNHPISNAAAAVVDQFAQQSPPQLKENSSKQQQQPLILSKNLMANDQQQLLSLKGCKEARRSLLFWVSYCIATS